MRVYIACGLTHVPKELFNAYTQTVHKLAKHLQDSGLEVKYALVDSDPQLANEISSKQPRLCYDWDKEMVLWADFIIAESSFPSTGIGIELQLADNKKSPIVLCYSDYNHNRAENKVYTNPDHKQYKLQIGSGYVSLMALGLPSIKSSFKYRDFSDLINKLNPILVELTNK